MAEHLNQAIARPMNAFDMMGKPIPARARQAGYHTCKAMGLDSARAYECTAAVINQLEPDEPYEAQRVAMKFIDLTGTYRLMAVLLAIAAQEKF